MGRRRWPQIGAVRREMLPIYLYLASERFPDEDFLQRVESIPSAAADGQRPPQETVKIKIIGF